jgi:hypothetical protein
MQPPTTANVGVRSRIEKLAEVHLAFVGESLGQRDPPANVVCGPFIHVDVPRPSQ